MSKKREYIEEHGIPARLFNAPRITLDGKVSAVRESQLLQLDSQRRRVSRAEKQVAEAAEPGRWRQVHEKRRRLANLKFRLSVLAADIVAGRGAALLRFQEVVAEAASPGGQWLCEP